MLDINWLTPTKRRTLTVTGERGMYVADYISQDLVFYANPQASPATSGGGATVTTVAEGEMTRRSVRREEPLVVELDEFAARRSRWRPAAGRPTRRDDRAAAGPHDGRVRRDRPGDRRPGAGGGAGVRIAVIGLGHIGLPLAVQYASRGHDVLGRRHRPAHRRRPEPRQSPHADEQALIERVPRLVADGRLRATTWADPRACATREAVVVIVPVVVDGRARDRRSGRSTRPRATSRAHRSRDALVVYETTLPVGTTRDRFGPMLAAGSGLELDATCSSPSVRSASSSAASSSTFSATRRSWAARAPRARAARSSSIGPRSTRGPRSWAVADAETAEMTKLAETTYRDVNIAYANELARFAARDGIDVSEVIGAANSQPYSHIHQPGVGVGGHCIPVYPHFLFNDEPELRIPPLAREINESHGRASPSTRSRIGSARWTGSRCSSSASPTAATCARTPSAPRSASGTSCAPPAPASMPTTRTSTTTTCASSASSRTTSMRRRRCGWRSSRPRTRRTGRSIRPRLPGLELLRRRPQRARPRAVRGAPACGMSESGAERGRRRSRRSAWRPVVGCGSSLPTYNERENLEPIAAAILAALPEASLLIVDDASPDGTGAIADTLAARDPRISVLHRPGKEGLGVAYRDGFRWVLERPDARAVVQMDADFSHDPPTCRGCSPR